MRKGAITAASIVFIFQIQSRDALADEPDTSVGETLYQKSCKSCHGPKAQGMASFPKLNDKTAQYITDRLKQYRSGETIGPNTPLMRPQAEKLSDKDITNLANYISNSSK